MKTSRLFKVTIHGQRSPRSVDIGKDSCVLGRGKDCDIEIDEDLISRKHLKITLDQDVLFVEELGSSNGTWFNSTKLIKGKKTLCSPHDVIHLGKANAGISIVVEKIAQQKLTVVNSDNEKTLVHRVLPKISEAVITDTRMVANGQPISIQVPAPTLTKPAITLVEHESPPIPMGDTHGHKHGLENKVKNLINQESQKLREIALRQSSEILEKAHEEEKNIIAKAKKEAQDIISRSQQDTEKLKKDASAAILSLQEKVRLAEVETQESVKSFQQDILRIQSSIEHLKKEEQQHQQKIAFLEDNVVSLQDKIRSENILLDDIKTQTSTLRKNADIKFEEIVMEERRARARMETELVEAKTQTAKVFAEAKKAQAQKEIMESEISQMRSDKGQIEREINELQINFKRQEYEYEKLTRDYNTLLEEKNTEQLNHEKLIAEGIGLADKFTERQNLLLDEEKDLQEKINSLKSQADSLIEQANLEAEQLVHAAHLKSREVADKSALQAKELEAHKATFYADFEVEKKNRFQDLTTDLEKQKTQHLFEIKKLEQKKENVASETKWLEENAHKKCEKIINQGHADVESMKAVVQKESERQKAAMELELQTIKTQLLKENEIQKANTLAEIKALKEKANVEISSLKKQAELDISKKQQDLSDYAAKMKQEAENFIQAEQNKWNKKHAELESEIKAAALVTKRHEAALEKTEALKDENFIAANLQAQSIISDAHKKAADIEKEFSSAKAREQATLLEMRRIEMEKIEDLKSKFEQYKIDNRNDMAQHTSLAVAEFLINDMIKSRNLVLNEGLIKKIAERARKLVIEANLGRIHPTEQGAKPFPTKDYRKIFRWTLRIGFLVSVVYFGFYAWDNYSKEIMMLVTDVEKILKDNNIQLEVPSKDQIIDFLR